MGATYGYVPAREGGFAVMVTMEGKQSVVCTTQSEAVARAWVADLSDPTSAVNQEAPPVV